MPYSFDNILKKCSVHFAERSSHVALFLCVCSWFLAFPSYGWVSHLISDNVVHLNVHQSKAKAG